MNLIKWGTNVKSNIKLQNTNATKGAYKSRDIFLLINTSKIMIALMVCLVVSQTPIYADEVYENLKISMTDSMKSASENKERERSVVSEYQGKLDTFISKAPEDDATVEEIYDRGVVVPAFIQYIATYGEIGISRDASPEMQKAYDDVNDLYWMEIEGEVRTFYATDQTNYYVDLNIALQHLYDLNQQLALSEEAMGLLESKKDTGITEDYYDSLVAALPSFGQSSPANLSSVVEVYKYLLKTGVEKGIGGGENPSIVEGYIGDDVSQEGIEGALVVIGPVSDITDNMVYFYIGEVPSGEVPITISASGYEELSMTLEVQGNVHYEGSYFYLTRLEGFVPEDSEGYKEEKDKLDKDGLPGGVLVVIGGALAGGALLLVRNGLRKKNKNYRKEKDETYQRAKKRETQIREIKSDYKDAYVNQVDTEAADLEKQRRQQLEEMQIQPTDNFGVSVGKGLKHLLKGAKSLGEKVGKVTDYVQDKINKIKETTLIEMDGEAIKIGHLTQLFGDPFSKFSRIKEAVDSFNKKDPIKWATQEIRKSMPWVKWLKNKVNLRKVYEKFKNSHKEIGKLVKFQKQVHMLEAIEKNPEMLLGDNVKAELRQIGESHSNFDNGIKDVIDKTEKKIHKTVHKSAESFKKDMVKGLNRKGVQG